MIEHPDDREARLADEPPGGMWPRRVVAVLGFIAILVMAMLGSLIETAPMGYLP